MTDLDVMHEQDYHGRFNWRVWKGVFAFVAAYRGSLIRLAVLGIVMAACDVAFPVLTWIILGIVEKHAGGLWLAGGIYFAVAAVWSVAVGWFIRAATAGPPSPAKPASPVPATVVMVPVFASIRRTP